MNLSHKRRISSLALFCSITLFGIGLIVFTKDVSRAAANAISLCMAVVIPSLFPFMVLSSLCVQTGMAHRLARWFETPMSYIFNLPGACSSAFVLGLIGGYPVGAKTAFDLYRRGLCTKDQCARLLMFCSNCGPAFIFSAVGAAIFNDLKAGLIIYLCHVASAVVIGFCAALLSRVYPSAAPKALSSGSPLPSLPSAFTGSVTSSIGAMINICGFVIFFAVLMSMLNASGAMDAVCALVPLGGREAFRALLSGLMEMTGGVASIGALAVPYHVAMALCAAIVSFGGLSVHCQVLSFSEPDVPMSRYFIGKSMQGLLCGGLAYRASSLLLGAAEAWHPVTYNIEPLTRPQFLVLLGIYLLLSIALMVLTLKWPD